MQVNRCSCPHLLQEALLCEDDTEEAAHGRHGLPSNHLAAREERQSMLEQVSTLIQLALFDQDRGQFLEEGGNCRVPQARCRGTSGQLRSCLLYTSPSPRD